ncbi:hypothetical protein [Mycobacterium bourgelatii]|uniref:hypothetical protein n=1 Tax=Mycobacterium bourgelatii TaxID=1273442 RepID=UPI0013D55334|nr:hypothetical protein [Mycobacterium bourgelatii]MCV6976461.1 hypothetical protein [Mycobacterium bourgelatii]
MAALVDAQVAREQGRAAVSGLGHLNDDQLADEIRDAYEALCLHTSEGNYLVQALRILSQRHYADPYADPAAHRSAMVRTVWLHTKAGRSRWRRRKMWRTRGVAGPLHYKARRNAVGILWAITLFFGFPLILMAATGFRIGHPGDAEAFSKAVLIPLSLLLVAYLHAKVKELLAVQRCEVNPDGTITLIRYDRRIPFDVKHYRYVRMYRWVWGAPRHQTVPGMLILRRDSPLTFWAALSTHIYPRFDDERVIVFLQTWRTPDGTRISPDAMGQVFCQACVRAGRTPLEVEYGTSGWELEDEY